MLYEGVRAKQDVISFLKIRNIGAIEHNASGTGRNGQQPTTTTTT